LQPAGQSLQALPAAFSRQFRNGRILIPRRPGWTTRAWSLLVITVFFGAAWLSRFSQIGQKPESKLSVNSYDEAVKNS
jgi:hypothetical protein